MADLDNNLTYLIVSFFGIMLIGFIFVYAIYGAVYPVLASTASSLPDSTIVIGGMTFTMNMIKIFIPSMFLVTLIAVIIYLFFKKEQENVPI